MVLLIIILHANAVKAENETEITWEYDITHVHDWKVPYINAQAVLKKAKGTRTLFSLPQYSIGNACLIVDPSQITYGAHKATLDLNTSSLEVFHKDGDDIVLNYNIQTVTSTFCPAASPLGAAITKDYVYFAGRNALVGVVPKRNDANLFNKVKVNCTINWHMPKQSSVIANAYGFDKTQVFTTNQNDFVSNICGR